MAKFLAYCIYKRGRVQECSYCIIWSCYSVYAMHALYFWISSPFKTSFYLLSSVSCLPSSNFFLPSYTFHPLSSKFKSSNFHILSSIFYFLPSIFLSAVPFTASCLEGNLWPDTVDKRWQEEARMAGTTLQMNQIGSIQTIWQEK